MNTPRVPGPHPTREFRSHFRLEASRTGGVFRPGTPEESPARRAPGIHEPIFVSRKNTGRLLHDIVHLERQESYGGVSRMSRFVNVPTPHGGVGVFMQTGALGIQYPAPFP